MFAGSVVSGTVQQVAPDQEKKKQQTKRENSYEDDDNRKIHRGRDAAQRLGHSPPGAKRGDTDLPVRA
jgi:hypothetical protein